MYPTMPHMPRLLAGVAGLDLAASPRPGSPRPLPRQHDLGGVEEADEVEEERGVLDVVEVVLELARLLLHGRAVPVLELGPTGEARLHQLAEGEEREAALQLLQED